MGVYLEKTGGGNLPMDWLKEVLSENGSLAEAERFCDSTGEYQRKYNVYKISAGEKAYVLKCSDKMETALYRDFLQGKNFAVPQYYGDTEYDGHVWLLMEYIDGPDLRRFDQEMAVASADTVSQIQKFFGAAKWRMEDFRDIGRGFIGGRDALRKSQRLQQHTTDSSSGRKVGSRGLSLLYG